jgi:hypothetical protein
MEEIMLRRSRALPGVLALAVLFSACRDRPPTEPPPEGRLFDRFVAIGNSITAGFESDGINDSTQVHAYSVRLAASFQAEFNVPLLRRPGCPPPLVGPVPLTNERVAGADPFSCAGFQTPIRQPVQNLAFPGFRIAEALTVPPGTVGLVYRQAFGNRSLVQAMADANPTLVALWLGNNDALSAMTSGDPGELTPLPEFQASLAIIVAAIAGRTTLRDAILIGVIDPLLAPLVQPGAYFWLVAQDAEGAALLPKPVSDDCAPLTQTGELNPRASNLVSFRSFADAAVAEISCADDAPYVLNAAEQAAISGRVEEFNSAIRASATSNQWIYVDASNEVVRPLLASPDQLRKCQGLLTADTPETLRLAVEQTCPHPAAPNFFGSSVSFDGVHPSREGQQLIADVIRAKLLEKHGPGL